MSEKKHKVKLDSAAIEYLETYINKGTHSARSIKRARVLLLASTGKSDEEIAPIVGYKSSMAIYHIRCRYCKEGIERALHDKKRSGRPGILTGRDEAHFSAIACSEAPDGRERWTLRLLADKLVEQKIVDSISHMSVGNYLKKTKSNPGKNNNGVLEN